MQRIKKWFNELFTQPTLKEPMVQEIKLTKEEMITLVQQIHDDFYGAEEELKKYCNDIILLTDEQQEFVNNIERLKVLGFKNVEIENPLTKEIVQINDVNKYKTNLGIALYYFNEKYPTYKFITQERLNILKSKYNLVMSNCQDYKGKVPLENIEHLEKFKIDEDDCLYRLKFKRYSKQGNYFCDNHDFTGSYKILKDYRVTKYPEDKIYGATLESLNKVPLQVVATPCDFIKGVFPQSQDSFKIPDPIVLQPVIYENVTYYLIVTAWSNI